MIDDVFELSFGINKIFNELALSGDERRLVIRKLLSCLDMDGDMGLRAKLPNIAPEFYNERKDRSEDAVSFINRVYGRWLGNGLARSDIMKLDNPLYQSLAYRVRKGDVDPQFLEMLSSVGNQRTACNGLDTAEALTARQVMYLLQTSGEKNLKTKGLSPKK